MAFAVYCRRRDRIPRLGDDFRGTRRAGTVGQRQGVDLRVFCDPHGDGLFLHDRDSASLTVATVCQSHAIRSMTQIEMLLLRKFWFVQTSQCMQATRSARRHMSSRGKRGGHHGTADCRAQESALFGRTGCGLGQSAFCDALNAFILRLAKESGVSRMQCARSRWNKRITGRIEANAGRSRWERFCRSPFNRESLADRCAA